MFYGVYLYRVRAKYIFLLEQDYTLVSYGFEQRVILTWSIEIFPTGPYQSESIHPTERIARAIQFSYWRCCVTAGDAEQVAHICKQELPAIRAELMQEASDPYSGGGES